MYAQLAQVVVEPGTEPVDLFQEWWIVASGVLVFVYPFIAKHNLSGIFRLVVSVALSIAVAVATMIPLAWEQITPDLVITRCMTFIGCVQVIYKLADKAVEKFTLDPETNSLSDLPLYDLLGKLKGGLE